MGVLHDILNPRILVFLHCMAVSIDISSIRDSWWCAGARAEPLVPLAQSHARITR